MKALVVVADPATQRRIEDFFKRRQHAIYVCSTSAAARSAIEIHSFQFVILDLTVDHETISLCRAIRERGGESTNILVIPQAETPADLRAALEAGANDYLPPPVSVAALQLRLAIGERTLAARLARGAGRSVENSERRYRTLVENMHEGLFEIDETGVIEFANSRLSEITGYALTELIGQVADELLITPEIRDRLPGRTLLGTDIGSEEYSIPLRSKDGRPIWVQLTGSPTVRTDGRAASIGIVHDVTEQREAEEGLRRKEEFFRAVLENSSDLTSILDRQGLIVYQSPSSERILGHRPEQLLGLPFAQHLVHPEDQAHWQEAFDIATSRAEGQSSVQIRLRLTANDWLHVDALVKNLLHDPLVAGIVVTSRDVNERRKVENALKRERAFFQQLFRNSPAGIAILDTADRVVDVNSAFVDLFHYEISELAGKSLTDFLVPDDLRDEAMELSMQVFKNQPVDREAVRLRRDGSRVDVAILAYPIELGDRRIGAFCLFTDITERKQVERKLFHEAFHDALTGLPNRTLLTERLERDLRRAQRRDDYQFAVIFIDLDRFKWVNDNLGHAIGDDLLKEMARRLESCLRPGDTTARLGGDEFVIILEDLKEVDDATRIAERILDSLALPFKLGGQEISTSGSIGISFSATGYERAEDILRDADIAMYRAKSGGKGRYELFDTEMQKTALERRQLETDLRQAIESHQLKLLFQPIISLRNGKTAGFEALLRWDHPQRGQLNPSDLLPLCEESGLITSIGRFVVEAALDQLGVWRRDLKDHDAMVLHINLSAKEVGGNDLLPLLDRAQRASGAHPGSMVIEIGESLTSPATPATTETLWQLRRRGYRLAVNDIGLANTSLPALQRLPLDMLKIDRTLIQSIEPGGDHVELVRAISAIGESFGLRVIAVGIENTDQLERIRDLGIDFVQGFHFSPPLTADQATELLRQDASWPVAKTEPAPAKPQSAAKQKSVPPPKVAGHA